MVDLYVDLLIKYKHHLPLFCLIHVSPNDNVSHQLWLLHVDVHMSPTCIEEVHDSNFSFFVAPLWAAQGAYFTDLSREYARVNKENEEHRIALFFGIYYMFYTGGKTSVREVLAYVCLHV